MAHPSRDPGLLALTVASGVAAILYGIIVPFLPGHAQGLGLDAFGIGLLFATYGLAGVAVTLLLAGRLRHTPPLTLFTGAMGVLIVATLVFAAGGASIPLLFIARFLQGAAGGAIYSVGSAITAARYTGDDRGVAMGIVAAGGALGMLLGPPLGGLLYDQGGWALPFVVTAVIGAVIALPCHRVIAATQVAAPAGDDGLTLSVLLADPGIRRICVAVIGGVALLALMEPVVPLWLTARFGADGLTNGLVFGGVALAYGLVTPLVGAWTDRVGDRLSISVVGFVLTGLILPLCLLAPGLGWAAGILALAGVGLAMILEPTTPAFADALDTHTVGAASPAAYILGYVLYSLIYNTGTLAGPTLGGAAVELVGLSVALGCSGIAAGLIAAMLWRR